MAIETHIHAFPLLAVVDTIYPDAVAVWDHDRKRLLIGDGVTINGIRVAMMSDLVSAKSVFLEQEFAALTATGEAGFNGEIYVHHLVAPSGTIHVIASGDCYWKDGYTYVKMAPYMQAEDMPTFTGTWVAVYTPRPAASE